MNSWIEVGLKWTARIVLVLLVLSMAYTVTRPNYNFAHWVPHNLLDNMGVPYSVQLWAEQKADIALHFFGASLLFMLLFFTQWLPPKKASIIALALVLLLCLAAEIVQFGIGRGFSGIDLLLGFCGAFVAYFTSRIM